MATDLPAAWRPIYPATWRPIHAATSRPIYIELIAHEITIQGPIIRLGQLLKLAGLVDSGSEVKALLAHTPTWVNGERESRRGRQLHDGDAVRVGEHELLVITASGAQRPA